MINQCWMLNGFKLEKQFQHVTVLKPKQIKAIVWLAALKYFPASNDKVHNFCMKKARQTFTRPYQKGAPKTLYCKIYKGRLSKADIL
jgi:hypothetical protein